MGSARQGSSREHAALAPRYLGLRMVLAKEFARIHLQNLVNFGILPMTFSDPAEYERVEQGDVLAVENLRRQVGEGREMVRNTSRNCSFESAL